MIEHADVFGGLIGFLLSVAAITVAVLLTVGVYRDLEKLKREGRTPDYMPSFGWILATAVFGPLGFLCYWLVHRSTLRR